MIGYNPTPFQSKFACVSVFAPAKEPEPPADDMKDEIEIVPIEVSTSPKYLPGERLLKQINKQRREQRREQQQMREQQQHREKRTSRPESDAVSDAVSDTEIDRLAKSMARIARML